MTDINRSELIVVMDRSGSMEPLVADMEGGLRDIVNRTREALKPEQRCNFTFVRFNSTYEAVYEAQDIRYVDASELRLNPGGGTALLDAVGRTINEVGARLRKTPEARRPARIAFVILTDGEENSSREFSRDTVKKMVETQRDVYSWEFIFLGAEGVDNFAQAGNIGISAQHVASYNFSAAGSRRSGALVGSRVANYTSNQSKGLTTNDEAAQRFLSCVDPNAVVPEDPNLVPVVVTP